MRLKRNIATFVALFSLANLFFIPEWANFFGEQHYQHIFVTPTPFENAYFAMAFTVLAVALVLFFLVLVADNLQARRLKAFIYCLIAFALLIPLNFVREVTAVFNHWPWLSSVSHLVFFKLIIPFRWPLSCAALLILIYGVRKWGQQATAGIRFLGLLFSPALFVTYSNLISLSKNQMEASSFVNAVSIRVKKPTQNRKVIWLIFDEMDYRLLFSKRPTNLKLPELDKLREQSIFATEAFPPSDYTLQSIPSLLTGHRVDIASIEASDLVLRDVQSKTNVRWNDLENIFQSAKSLGYSSSLVGWYHNYCRIFRGQIDYCRRLPAGRFGYSKEFWGSVTAILERSFIFDKRLERAFIFNMNKIHKTVIENILSKNHDFMFLHYSVPHKPYLFDLPTEKLSPYVSRSPKNYLGNLKKVDNILGDIRRALESSGQWNDTVIVLSSDHSWRQSEEYDGQRDFRVPFLVKMVDGKGVTLSKPLPTLITKSFIEAIMRNKVTDTSSAIDWLSKRSISFPSGTVLVPFKDEENQVSRKNFSSKNHKT